MKAVSIAGIALLLLSSIVIAQQEPDAELFVDQHAEVSAEQLKYERWAKGIWDSLDRQTGEIKLDSAGAVLNVPEGFYFLNAKDSETVLVDVWGNMPGQNVLGMLFPAEATPFDADSWAVTVEYEQDGYVSDEDAGDINYDELLQQMKEDTRSESSARMQQGYESIELVGWASKPYYDSIDKKLYWAKELNFGGAETNTLNYNIRVLGRRGVLLLNFIAGMDQVSVIDANIDTVLAIAEFDQGARYSDFDPSVDQVAAYGLGALVAGKVASKAGILAAALLFIKKFWFVIAAAIAGLVKLVSARKRD